jgi:hypothetical protein
MEGKKIMYFNMLQKGIEEGDQRFGPKPDQSGKTPWFSGF